MEHLGVQTVGWVGVIVGLLAAIGCESPSDGEAGDRSTPVRTVEQSATSASGEQTGHAMALRERLGDLAIHGHRGARGLRPENTLPAFERALDLKVDVLELDLHLSRDDKLVVWHDPFVRETKCRIPEDAPDALATTTERERDSAARLRSLTAEELAGYDCSKHPDPEAYPRQTDDPTALAGDDYGIVTLTRLLDFVDTYADSDRKTDAQRTNARRVGFNIELKRHPRHPEFIDDGFDGSGPATMERRLVELVRQRQLVDRVTVQSFDPRSIGAVHTLAPDFRLAALESSRHLSFAKLGNGGVEVWSPDAELVDETTLRQARAAGLAVLPWTVNERDEMEQLAELGVDGLITDRPDLVAGTERGD